MRLLFDQNVDRRYIDACNRDSRFFAATVGEVLDPRAADLDIVRYAAEGYVVFTSDDDFFRLDAECGRILYEQTTRPPAGDVLDALGQIREAYDDHSDIVEVVPGGWV